MMFILNRVRKLKLLAGLLALLSSQLLMHAAGLSDYFSGVYSLIVWMFVFSGMERAFSGIFEIIFYSSIKKISTKYDKNKTIVAESLKQHKGNRTS